MSALWKILSSFLILSYAVEPDGGGSTTDDDKGDEAEDDADDKDADEQAEEVEESDEPEEKEKDEVKEEDEAPTKKEAKAKDKGERVPRSRLDKVVAQAKAKDAEIDRLTRELEKNATTADIQAVRTKIDELDDTYEEQLADGKVAEAKETRKELRRLQDIYHNALTQLNSGRAQTAAVEQMRYNVALDRYEADFPEINPEHEEFDEALTTEVADLVGGLTKNGVSRADALARAVKYVLGATKASSSSLRDTRRSDAVKRGAEASRRQPADIGKHGKDGDSKGDFLKGINVMRMNQSQFAKLDDEAKSKLRGDVV